MTPSTQVIARQRVRALIEHLVRHGTAIARSDGSLHALFPVAIGEREGTALREWVIRERAKQTIEVGLGYGLSALFVAEGLLINGEPGARHVAIDPHQSDRFGNCALQFLDETGIAELVEHRSEESLLALPQLLAEGRRFDLAFVDGNHRFDGVFVDLVYLGRLLRPGGIVFLDDYHLPGVARAVSFFTANLGWRVEQVSTVDEGHHFVVLRTSREPDIRPFHYFVEF